MSYDGPPIKSVTDEWIECFSKPENQSSAMARLSVTIGLSVGVDSENEEVKKILKQIKEKIDEEG